MLSASPLVSQPLRPQPGPAPEGAAAPDGAAPPFARALDQATARQRQAGDPPAADKKQKVDEDEPVDPATDAADATPPGAPAAATAKGPAAPRKAMAGVVLAALPARVPAPEVARSEVVREARIEGSDEPAQNVDGHDLLALSALMSAMPQPLPRNDSGHGAAPGTKADPRKSPDGRAIGLAADDGPSRAALARDGLLPADETRATPARSAPGLAVDANSRADAAQAAHGLASSATPGGASPADGRAALEAIAQKLAPGQAVATAAREREPGALVAPPGLAVSQFVRPAAEAAGSTFHAQLSAALGSPEFAPALGAQLSVLVRDGIEHAQLKLNPAHMGPIDVRISLDGKDAQVDFSAAHATTRQLLQDAVPALASALRESGLTLTGGGVFEQPRDPRGQAQGEARGDAARGSASPGGERAEASAAPAPLLRMPRARGVVDLYA